jgi:DNA-binding GntR family transcriptional regulator
VEGGPQRGQIHHKRILEAVERHDPEMARSAMRSHLEQVREDSKAPVGIPSSHGKHAPASSKVSS